ncbi:MFS transporter permease [Frankia sp. AiPs1]|uniref:MFS transporter n=1 Tax=Frankia sp. AiPa1 TaxID=573492 RepID=UPI00202B0175|nr:MFS transporter [Frankia sp. AiPa1]MCL9759200.1 MFS transporter [Frankia sp. AiPa1]
MSLGAKSGTVSPALSVAALCLGGMAASLTQTVVIPIQSELPGLLGTSASSAAWVVTVTLLAAAVSMVVAGRLGDLLGKQRVLVASVMILLAGTVLCAVSSTLVPMLVGRAMQGMAMGVVPVGISLIRQITPPAMAPTALASMSATLGVGGAIGLPLSAWIVNVSDWHALFWVTAAIDVVVLLLLVLLVPHVHDAHGGSLDVAGVIGLAAGLVAFLIGISKGGDWGWASPSTLGSILGGLVVLVVWGVYELRRAEPLVDLRSSAKRQVLMTNAAAIAVGFGMMAQAIVAPQLLQLPRSTGYGLGQSVLAAGLWMAPGGLMMMLFAPVSSKLIATVGARVTMMTGALVLSAGYALGALWMDASWELLLVACVTSAGVGIGYAAMPTLIMDATPPSKAGAAVGLNSLSRSVGTSLAAAVMGTLLASNTTTLAGVGYPTHEAFRLCFVIGAVAALLAVMLAGAVSVGRSSRTADIGPVPGSGGAATAVTTGAPANADPLTSTEVPVGPGSAPSAASAPAARTTTETSDVTTVA